MRVSEISVVSPYVYIDNKIMVVEIRNVFALDETKITCY